MPCLVVKTAEQEQYHQAPPSQTNDWSALGFELVDVGVVLWSGNVLLYGVY